MRCRLLKIVSVGMVVLMMIQGCTDFRPRVGAPWAQKLLTQGPKNSSTLFQEGWTDGCETGISSSSNALQRHFYSFKQNPEHILNQTYYTGWKVAFLYCARYTAQYLRRQYL